MFQFFLEGNTISCYFNQLYIFGRVIYQHFIFDYLIKKLHASLTFTVCALIKYFVVLHHFYMTKDCICRINCCVCVLRGAVGNDASPSGQPLYLLPWRFQWWNECLGDLCGQFGGVPAWTGGSFWPSHDGRHGSGAVGGQTQRGLQYIWNCGWWDNSLFHVGCKVSQWHLSLMYIRCVRLQSWSTSCIIFEKCCF